MYWGLIQEAEDNFAFEGLCSFLVEGRYGSSFAPAVAPGIYCLSILAGHVPNNQEAVIVGTTGIAPVVGAVLAALTVPGTTLIALDTDTPTGIEMAAPGIALIDLGSKLGT